MLWGGGSRGGLRRRYQRALCCPCLLHAGARRRRALSLQALHLETLLSLQTLLRLQTLLLQRLERLVSQVQLVLLHDALLHNTLLHFDVLVHGKLVDRVEGSGGRGVRRGESLPLHLRTLKRFVQPLHR